MIFLFGFFQAFGQVENPVDHLNDPTYTLVEEMPEPLGGMQSFYKFIAQTIKFPENALKDTTFSGCKVFLKFIINKEGDIIDPIVLRGCNAYPECDKEALRVIALSPKWKPGKQNNRPVNVYFTLPINFRNK